ncbi:MAG: thioesterase family protein [Pseudomonadota bacterium]
MNLSETYRSFVNTWECDENSHWNVQYYFRAFQQAREVFLAEASPGTIRTAPELFHVRYLRELPAAQSILVKSGVIEGGSHDGWLVHLMENPETGELSATCLDNFRADDTFSARIDHTEIDGAMPRGLTVEAPEPMGIEALLASGNAIVSHKSVVRPFETDHEGNILFHAIVSRFTDCASHVWNHVGLTTNWLEQNDCGRVAVETKLTRIGSAPAGSAIRIVSSVTDLAEKSFAIVHQLEDMRSGKPVALGEVRCVVMDLRTRKVIALPEIMSRFE